MSAGRWLIAATLLAATIGFECAALLWFFRAAETRSWPGTYSTEFFGRFIRDDRRYTAQGAASLVACVTCAVMAVAAVVTA